MSRTPRTIAQSLVALRTRVGLSQDALARKADLSVSAVQGVEQGTRLDPALSTVRALARALGVTLDELAGGTA